MYALFHKIKIDMIFNIIWCITLHFSDVFSRICTHYTKLKGVLKTKCYDIRFVFDANYTQLQKKNHQLLFWAIMVK